jgi:hypothetical protein
MPSPLTFTGQSRADARKLAALEEKQVEFDFLMPFSERRALLSVKEVCLCIGREETFILERVQDGSLEAHGTAPAGETAGRRVGLRITRRSVLLWLTRTAQYEPEYFLERLLKCVDALTPQQCEVVIKRATARRAKL